MSATPPAPSRRVRIIGTLVLLAVGLGFALAVAEVALRIYTASSDTWLAHGLAHDPYEVLVEPHGVHGYRPRAGSSFEYDGGIVAHHNSLGFRGPEVARIKPAGTVRIVLLGGSTTHGWGVSDDETIDHHMRQLLAERFPGRRFEVLNLGFDGYDTYQLWQRLQSDAIPLDPDFVIVNTGINDVRNARFANLGDPDPRTLIWGNEMARLEEEARNGGPALWTRVKHYLYLARLPWVVRDRMRASGDQVDTRPAYPDAMDNFERNLERIATATERAGAVLILSIAPSSLLTRYAPDARPERSYWLTDARTTQAYRDSLHARLRAVVERSDSIGLSVVYAPHDTLDPGVFLDDAHLTGEGNRQVAEDFVATLVPLLDERAAVVR